MRKKILFVTDFSVASEKAFKTALQLLNDKPCEIILFHAYGSESPSKCENTLAEKSKYYTNKFREELEIAYPLHSFEAVVSKETPQNGIVEIHEEVNFYLIVLGISGVGASKQVGRVATYVYDKLPTNVILIPYFSQQEKINHTLFVLEVEDKMALKIPLMIFKCFMEAFNSSSTLMFLTKDEIQEQLVRELYFWKCHEIMKGHNFDIKIVNNKNIGEAMCNVLLNEETDLLAMYANNDLKKELIKRAGKLPIEYFRPLPFLKIDACSMKQPKPVLNEVCV